MEIKEYDSYKEEVKVNPEGFMFDIKCKKCKGVDILIETDNSIEKGSEYTGLYGDASAVIKCKTCGNAYSITVMEY